MFRCKMFVCELIVWFMWSPTCQALKMLSWWWFVVNMWEKLPLIDFFMLSHSSLCGVSTAVPGRSRNESMLDSIRWDYVLQNHSLSTFLRYHDSQQLTNMDVDSSNCKYQVLYLKEKHLLQDEINYYQLITGIVWVGLMNFGYYWWD